MTESLRETPLHARHVSLGARMVPFAGWSMPVQYVGGVIEEHRAVRSSAGVFDVSHMGRFELAGDAAHAELQGLLSNDLSTLVPGEAQYTLLTNARGGIVDDLIAYRRPDGYLLVVNAGNRDVDLAQLRDGLSTSDLSDASDATAMLALQGPDSLGLLASISEGAFDVGTAPAFSFGSLDVAGVPCTAARTGYTGELGVELIAPAAEAVRLWDALTAAGAVACGLGARDTLRLEVCYPLHGNDIGPDTNAIEAGLGWVCARDIAFSGSDVLARTRAAGPARRLVAFRMLERAIPRGGCAILDASGATVGQVTSGTMSPSLGEGIGMGYVPTPLSEPGSALVIDVRGRRYAAEVASKPLYRKEP